jgi:hypothetical protein
MSIRSVNRELTRGEIKNGREAKAEIKNMRDDAKADGTVTQGEKDAIKAKVAELRQDRFQASHNAADRKRG